MPFSFDYSAELKEKLRIMLKRDKMRLDKIDKKVQEIINRDIQTIDGYKNLKSPKNYLKRVHIDTSFVLTFEVFKDKNFILFVDFDHHDNIY